MLDVCVRSKISGCCSMKKVSCMSRAGCSGGKFRDSNTCQSSSISGPSATVKPMRENISMISFLTRERVASAESDRFGSTSEVEFVSLLALSFECSFKLVKAILRSVAKVIEELTYFTFLFVRYFAELVEEFRYFAFFAEVFNTYSL